MFFEKLVGKNKAGLWLLWVDSNKEAEPGSRGRLVGRANRRKKDDNINFYKYFGFFQRRRECGAYLIILKITNIWIGD